MPPFARLPLLVTLLTACGDDGASTSSPATTAASTTSTASSTTGEGSDTTGTSADDPTTATDSPTSTTSATSSAPSTSTTGADALPPTDSAELLEQWLAAGSYTDWPSESQIHGSAGPHGGNVRTYVNAALAASLMSGAAMHPQGAATVKELYGAGTDAIVGYAVMVKLAPDSQSGAGWYWYERLEDSVFADGTDVDLCTACHADGSDYVLTPYPLQ